MKELSCIELQHCAGGWNWLKFIGKLSGVGIILDALDNIPDLRDGFHDGYNNNQPRHRSS